jgi:hypothetical protein
MDDLNCTNSVSEFIGVLGDFARWMRQPETCICGNDRCCGECCDPRDEMYMGSDSDFSDHALGIDY